MGPVRIWPMGPTPSEDPDSLGLRHSVLSCGGATGEALLGVREPLAACYQPVRDSHKQVAAVWLGTCIFEP